MALVFGALGACDDVPKPPGDFQGTAAVHDRYRLPERIPVDILLVIDNSSSMVEEQANLTRNVSRLSGWLADELMGCCDVRLAVTSTDLADPAQRGRFLYRPAAPEEGPANGLIEPFDTADCPAEADPILNLRTIGDPCPADDRACVAAEVERQVRCRATLGLGGDDFSQGLEALRLSLSCTGPNAARFGSCCVDGAYDPACEPTRHGGPAPDFLRPDAVLFAVIISDADDCSDTPEAPIGRQHPDQCEWQRDRLTPVDDYFNFLVGLKAHPAEQLLVLVATGRRAYTTSGEAISYHPPGRAEDQLCLDSAGRYHPGRPCGDDADCPGTGNACHPDGRCTGEGAEAVCCPGGACVGSVLSSCVSANAVATAGRRYLALAERFDEAFRAGVGCPPGSEDGDMLDADGSWVECVSICQDDYLWPLFAEVNRGTRIEGHYCLDVAPACWVPGAAGPRPCSTDAERAEVAHYAVRVLEACGPEAERGGECTDDAPAVPLAAAEYRLELDASQCLGDAAVQLQRPSPHGARLYVEYARAVAAEPR